MPDGTTLQYEDQFGVRYAYYIPHSLTTVTVDYGEITLHVGNVFKNCEFVQQIYLTGSIQLVSINAFDGCKLLQSLIMPTMVSAFVPYERIVIGASSRKTRHLMVSKYLFVRNKNVPCFI